MRKTYLLAPGPTPVPDNALLAMAQPMIHHRTPQFSAMFAEVKEDLKYLFQTKQDVLILAASGTGAMEGSITNLFSPGDEVLVINGGKFGERWGKISEAFGLKAHIINVEWGKAVDPKGVKKILDANPKIKGVLVQASETSTTVAHPIKELAAFTKNRQDCVLIVDGITSVGVFPTPMDDWGIDVLVSGSQKAFMLPPGLAFASLSEKAWKFMETAKCPRFYFDFKKERKNLKDNTTAYTPAVSLIIGLREALKMIKAEGLENVFARHSRLARATRAAIKALGLKLLAPDSPSDASTGAYVPEGVDGGKFVKYLRDDMGVTMAGGQDHLKGKIIRIAHLGYVDNFDI
ncbi:MAG: class V aminotransferase, partial [Deltaproteobacteria bacterium GWB2_42_7]